jgi:hypothetical protein
MLQAPLQAQTSEAVATASGSQTLLPDPADFNPPGFPPLQSTLFGSVIAHHRDTALIQEAAYPASTNVGRVAVFTRDSNGLWERSDTIDPPSSADAGGFGYLLAIFDNIALIGSPQGISVFHHKDGNWKRVQILRLKAGWGFTDAAINRDFAFLATSRNGQGVVYAYRVTRAGRLAYLQRLDSGVDFDSFAEHLALSGDHLVVSATHDENRGAAYVFERTGARWGKRQKIVAIDGANGDTFSAAVAIAGDWLAVGAPNVLGLRDPFCEGGINTGAIYVFHRISGLWQQQQVIPADEARFSSPCVEQFGSSVVMSRKWIVTSTNEFSGAEFLAQPTTFQREAGHYMLTGTGSGLSVRDAPTLSLRGRTLFLGFPAEEGCQFDACLGFVNVGELEEVSP